MEESPVARRFVVTGRVQGVGFRDSVLRVALRLGGLRGHVRNLRNGSVETCVAGDPAKVAEIKAFMAKGPPLARVDRLDDGPWEPHEPPPAFCVVFR
jgi:acylphosphatase